MKLKKFFFCLFLHLSLSALKLAEIKLIEIEELASFVPFLLKTLQLQNRVIFKLKGLCIRILFGFNLILHRAYDLSIELYEMRSILCSFSPVAYH